MNKATVVIVDSDMNFISSMAAELNKSNMIGSIESAANGIEALRLIDIVRPDIIITDIILSGCDGISLLRKLSKSYTNYKPLILVNSQTALDSIVKFSYMYGAKYFTVKPQLVNEYCQTILDLYSSHNSELNPQCETSEPTMEMYIKSLLKHLCIPVNINGYKYMMRSFEYLSEDMSLITPITKKLYPKLAEDFNVTTSSVERSLRHAISISWKKGNRKLLSSIFGSCDNEYNKPTNSEYLSMVADDFNLRVKNGQTNGLGEIVF